MLNFENSIKIINMEKSIETHSRMALFSLPPMNNNIGDNLEKNKSHRTIVEHFSQPVWVDQREHAHYVEEHRTT